MPKQWTCRPLPYEVSAQDWYEAIRHLPMAVLLDSGKIPQSGTGKSHSQSRTGKNARFDIVTALPSTLVTARLSGAREASPSLTMRLENLTDRSNPFCAEQFSDPFALIQSLVSHFKPDLSPPLDSGFAGGAIGYFSYDLGLHLHDIKLSSQSRNVDGATGSFVSDFPVPALIWGIYEWNILIDHEKQSSHLLISPDVSTDTASQIQDSIANTGTRSLSLPDFKPLKPPTCDVDASTYKNAFARAMAYIQAGDCYQVNLARRFSTTCTGDPFSLYRQIRDRHGSPFSAYMDFAELQILSFSPERFLKVESNCVLTEPIKGTRPRGSDEKADRQLSRELVNSPKDLAENLMIVDLLRNDLGQCCVPGTVSVPDLQKLESFDNVHHLVSSITGKLAQGKSPMDLMRCCLPGGSITGAPKRRTMAIIEELETGHRGVYCGSIGYYGFDGNLDSNIAIRTLYCTQNELCFWGGGGIVADSLPEEEYQESQDKINFIYEALLAAASK